MPKLNQDHSPESAEELIQHFAAAGNFPEDHNGVIALCSALKRASNDFDIPMSDIVRECSDSSAWCPTPNDIRNVAFSMRSTIRNRKSKGLYADWEKIYGPALPEWSEDLLQVAADAPHDEQKRALHLRAIRDTLMYTEGPWSKQGDRKFWDEAAKSNVAKWPALVEQERATMPEWSQRWD